MGKFFRGRRGGKRYGLKRRRNSVRGGRRFTSRVRKVVTSIAEKKFVDALPLYDGTVSNLGVFIPMGFHPVQGTSSSQRVGDKILRKSIKLTFQWFYDNSFTTTRMIIFSWNQNAGFGVLPSLGNILADTGLPLISPFNRTNQLQGMFTVMYDRVWVKNEQVESASYASIQKLAFFGKRLPFKRTTYIATTNSTQNNYYVLLINDHTALSPASVQVSGRMTFTDV